MNRHGKHLDLSKTFVVSVVSNAIRYASRYRLYKQFEEEITRHGAKLITVELQTGARTHKITDPTNPDHFQIWNSGLEGIVWTKEALQNYAVQQMTLKYPDWRYVIFCDSDIQVSKTFVAETTHLLQMHPIAQPWSHSADYSPDGSAISEKMQLSFSWCYVNNIIRTSNDAYTNFMGHPGYIFAMRREAYNEVGGLIDIGICGSGDRHALSATVGQVDKSYHPDVSDGYKQYLSEWQKRAVSSWKKNLGTKGEILLHYFHGSKKHRYYGDRWKILTKFVFNPYTDLKKDTNGLWQLVVEDERQMGLRDALYRYFRSRLEDANAI